MSTARHIGNKTTKINPNFAITNGGIFSTFIAALIHFLISYPIINEFKYTFYAASINAVIAQTTIGLSHIIFEKILKHKNNSRINPLWNKKL